MGDVEGVKQEGVHLRVTPAGGVHGQARGQGDAEEEREASVQHHVDWYELGEVWREKKCIVIYLFHKSS